MCYIEMCTHCSTAISLSGGKHWILYFYQSYRCAHTLYTLIFLYLKCWRVGILRRNGHLHRTILSQSSSRFLIKARWTVHIYLYCIYIYKPITVPASFCNQLSLKTMWFCKPILSNFWEKEKNPLWYLSICHAYPTLENHVEQWLLFAPSEQVSRLLKSCHGEPEHLLHNICSVFTE